MPKVSVFWFDLPVAGPIVIFGSIACYAWEGEDVDERKVSISKGSVTYYENLLLLERKQQQRDYSECNTRIDNNGIVVAMTRSNTKDLAARQQRAGMSRPVHSERVVLSAHVGMTLISA